MCLLFILDWRQLFVSLTNAVRGELCYILLCCMSLININHQTLVYPHNLGNQNKMRWCYFLLTLWRRSTVTVQTKHCSELSGRDCRQTLYRHAARDTRIGCHDGRSAELTRENTFTFAVKIVIQSLAPCSLSCSHVTSKIRLKLDNSDSPGVTVTASQ